MKTAGENIPVSRLLVAVQFFGILLACIPFAAQPRGSLWLLLLCVIGAGLGIATLAFNKIGNFNILPEIKSGASLITGGPYRYIRHPMYTALVVMMAGIALYNAHVVNYLGLLLVAVAVFLKAGKEERYLQMRFPQYAAYALNTRRFLPYIY
jgi:protein-S-isoprenylcysteine O-methyltransferase Ste14